MRLHVIHILHAGFFPQPRRLIRLHRWPSHSLHQQPGRKQSLIPNHFRWQPQSRPPRQQPILRIPLQRFRI